MPCKAKPGHISRGDHMVLGKNICGGGIGLSHHRNRGVKPVSRCQPLHMPRHNNACAYRFAEDKQAGLGAWANGFWLWGVARHRKPNRQTAAFTCMATNKAHAMLSQGDDRPGQELGKLVCLYAHAGLWQRDDSQRAKWLGARRVKIAQRMQGGNTPKQERVGDNF